MLFDRPSRYIAYKSIFIPYMSITIFSSSAKMLFTIKDYIKIPKKQQEMSIDWFILKSQMNTPEIATIVFHTRWVLRTLLLWFFFRIDWITIVAYYSRSDVCDRVDCQSTNSVHFLFSFIHSHLMNIESYNVMMMMTILKLVPEVIWSDVLT
jgi:hypothetical protein